MTVFPSVFRMKIDAAIRRNSLPHICERMFRLSIKWAEPPKQKKKGSLTIGTTIFCRQSEKTKSSVLWLKGFGDMAVPLYGSNRQSLSSASFLAVWQRIEKGSFFYTTNAAPHGTALFLLLIIPRSLQPLPGRLWAIADRRHSFWRAFR